MWSYRLERKQISCRVVLFHTPQSPECHRIRCSPSQACSRSTRSTAKCESDSSFFRLSNLARHLGLSCSANFETFASFSSFIVRFLFVPVYLSFKKVKNYRFLSDGDIFFPAFFLARRFDLSPTNYNGIVADELWERFLSAACFPLLQQKIATVIKNKAPADDINFLKMLIG